MGYKTVKPEFFHCPDFGSLPVTVKLAFGAVFTNANTSGRYPNDWRRLKKDVFPCDSDLGEKEIRNIIDTLIKKRYLQDDGKFLKVVDYTKNKLMGVHNSNRPAIKNWATIRKEVFERDKYQCRYCGVSTPDLHCDHIVPYSKGGSNDMSNLAASCRKCNRSKGSSTHEKWKR